MLTRTRLVAYPEPDPLAGVSRRTESWLLPTVEPLLERIDAVLAQAPLELGLLELARLRRTRLQDEPEPLAVGSMAMASHRREGVLGRSAHLDRCLDSLQEWLGIGLMDVCAAAGISRATVYAWRARGSTPRPGTVNGVLRLHGLVHSAVNTVGIVPAREWFHAGSPSPIERLKLSSGDPDTASAIGRELRRSVARPVLPPPNRLLEVTLDDTPASPLA